MTTNDIRGFSLIAIGLLALLGAAFNWSIVNRSGKILNRLLGDGVARMIYAATGAVLILLGAARLAGLM